MAGDQAEAAHGPAVGNGAGILIGLRGMLFRMRVGAVTKVVAAKVIVAKVIAIEIDYRVDLERGSGNAGNVVEQ